MLTGFPPKVFVIGAQKCGTTTLAALLGGNPEICLAHPKEPNFYSVNFGKGHDWYKQCFTSPEKILVDASTTYSMIPLSSNTRFHKPDRNELWLAPSRIAEEVGEAKLIYIVRDPVARTYSNYWHNVKYGYEKKSFLEAIQSDPFYIEVGMYFKQLQHYLENFKRENLLILKFEDLVLNQQDILNQCEAFIGVTQTELEQGSEQKNKGRKYNRLGNFLINNRKLRKADKYLPTVIKSFLQRSLSKGIPRLSDEDARRVSGYFAEDQKSLEALIADQKKSLFTPDTTSRTC